MLRIFTKSILTGMVVLLMVGIFAGSAPAASITLDAIDDAGLFPGQGAYIMFQPGNISVAPPAQWTSAQQVYDYAYNEAIINWTSVESAGNIWSADQIVGESLTGLHAGTYRITPVAGAYRYDRFGWSSATDQMWRWEMHIQAVNNGSAVDYLLGSTTPQTTQLDAFNAISGSYLDIAMVEGGALHFWIWDTNSIDNAGSLTANVASVPEPAAFLLLGLGLTALSGFRKRK